jgi:DNA-binding NarL/FixJ family response regulator
MRLLAGRRSWQNHAVAAAKNLSITLAELRDMGRSRQRRLRVAEAANSIARLIAACRTVAIEERPAGIVFRLTGETEQHAPFNLSCTLHATSASPLTTAEAAVAELLCEGRTRAQIARARGVSENTVKSQIRQIFRKLNVDSRVELVRRWCA